MDKRKTNFDLLRIHFGHGGNFIFMLITGYFLFGREISFPKTSTYCCKSLICYFVLWNNFYADQLLLISEILAF